MSPQSSGEHKGRVLVVEDDGLVADMIAMLLARRGYHVVEVAMDGVAALEAVTRLRPDVVVMDLGMPKMGGVEAALHIQQLAPTPIVLLTAYDVPELATLPAEAGVIACLAKPPNGWDLDHAITGARPVPQDT